MTSPAPGRPRPIRWAIALLVTVAMLISTTGVVVFAQTGDSGGPAFAPASTVAWAEARLDLPGNQGEELAQLLGHFPGFADPAALDAKIDEMLDQVVSEASNGAASWTGDIDPWSNRQFGLALLEIPASAAISGDDDNGPPAMVVGLGVKDRTALEARLSTFLTQAPISTEQYAGATVTTVDDDVSYAVTDAYLLVAPHATDVKASLDVLAGTAPSLAEDPGFAAAAQRIPADRLSAFYFALSAMRPLIEAQLSAQPGSQMALDMLDQLPAWVSGYAQAASDHLTLAFDMQLPDTFPVPAMRETDLATHFAPGTLAYLEMRDVGRTFRTSVEAILAQVPEDDAEGLAQVEQLLGAPVEAILDPIEDVAIGVGFAGGQPQVGIAASLSDPETAMTRVTSMMALVRLFATQTDATITDSQVAGTTVTTIALPSGTAGMGQPISVSIALADDRLYVGLGDFVEVALTQGPADSLASDARFANAVSVAGSPNSGLAYVDLAGSQALIESMGGITDDDYQTNVKPWLDALDYLVLSGTANGDTLSAKQLLFVR